MLIIFILIILISVLFLLGRHLGNHFIQSLSFKQVFTILPGIILFIFLIIPYASLPIYSYISYPLVYQLVIWSLFTLYIYFVLYKKFGISRSFLSYMWFYVNLLIFYTYLVAFHTLVYDLKEPFYLEDFSVFAQYRYLSFSIIGLIILLLYISSILTPIKSHLKSLSSFLFYPYLYEETKKILVTWEFSFWGPLFDSIIKKINVSKNYRYTFFALHTLFLYIFPFFFALLLAYVIFFHYDLCYIIYLMPLSFIIWIYRHLAYYFLTFLEMNFLAVRENLNIILLGKNISLDPDIVSYNSKEICFTLSEKALREYGPEYDHVMLLKNFRDGFLFLGKCQTHVLVFLRPLSYVPYIILALRYLTWIKISFFFFYSSDIVYSVNFMFAKSLFNPKIIIRPYVTKSYYLDQFTRSALKAATNGAYQSNHPVTTDVALADSQGNVPFMHQPTKGNGPYDNPSKLLSTHSTVSGNPGTQLSTGMTYPNPCGVSPQNHQQLPVSDPVITLELAGNATSRIPSNKKGIIVDPVEKINGDKQPQEFVIEKDKVPVSGTAVKENKKSTAYFQKDERTNAIINAMPADSTLNQK